MNPKSNLRNLILLAFLISGLFSCGIRLKGAKRGGMGSVETFLVEGGATQYFIKPVTFINGKNKMLVDFGLRNRQADTTNGRINFTLSGNNLAKIDSYQVINSDTKSVIARTAQLQSTTAPGGGRRYFSLINNNSIYKNITEQTPIVFILYSGNTATKYTPTKGTSKVLNRIPKILMED